MRQIQPHPGPTDVRTRWTWQIMLEDHRAPAWWQRVYVDLGAC